MPSVTAMATVTISDTARPQLVRHRPHGMICWRRPGSI